MFRLAVEFDDSFIITDGKNSTCVGEIDFPTY